MGNLVVNLVGKFHIIGTIYGVFNIRVMGLTDCLTLVVWIPSDRPAVIMTTCGIPQFNATRSPNHQWIIAWHVPWSGLGLLSQKRDLTNSWDLYPSKGFPIWDDHNPCNPLCHVLTIAHMVTIRQLWCMWTSLSSPRLNPEYATNRLRCATFSMLVWRWKHPSLFKDIFGG